VEEFTRPCRTWAWREEVGRTRETEKGRRSTNLACTRWLHGSAGWTDKRTAVLQPTHGPEQNAFTQRKVLCFGATYGTGQASRAGRGSTTAVRCATTSSTGGQQTSRSATTPFATFVRDVVCFHEFAKQDESFVAASQASPTSVIFEPRACRASSTSASCLLCFSTSAAATT